MLEAQGYDVKPKKPSPWINAKGLGNIETLIDIGVAHGTQKLYEQYPQAYLLLIEPLEESRSAIEEILSKRHGEWKKTAAGSCKSETTINIDSGNIRRSSLLKRTAFAETPFEKKQSVISVNTLDSIVSSSQSKPPFGIKIDTEGYELEVLRGAKETLKNTSFIITECQIEKCFEDSYTVENLFHFMGENGFNLSKIIDAEVDNNSVVRMVDFAFIKKRT